MATVRQTLANRRNALKSTGPRTDVGKARSSGNAVTHGLTSFAGPGPGPGPASPGWEAAEIRRRLADWEPSLRPETPRQCWLAVQVVTESVRLERCQRHERDLLARQARRAEVDWEDDRRLAAEEVGSGLAKNPGLVRRKLESTPQGCDWLAERWEALGRALDADPARGGGWTEARQSLALDLLGVPTGYRDCREADPVAAPRAVVNAELARLARRKANALDALDADLRDATTRGLGEPDRALTLVRRYEAACLRRLQWALARLREESPPGTSDRPPAAEVQADAEPEPEAEVDADPSWGDPPRPPALSADPSADEPRGNRRWRRAQTSLARRDNR